MPRGELPRMDDPISSMPPTLRISYLLRSYASLDASEDIGFQTHKDLTININSLQPVAYLIYLLDSEALITNRN